MTSIKSLSFLALATLTLSSCSGVRETIGLTKSVPDEFKVVKNAPLEMPPSFDLPAPQPGAPRPQEVAVSQKAKETLLGQTTSAQRPTEAESLLLRQAGADQSQEDIRRLIDTKAGLQDESAQSVAKRLLGIGGEDMEAKVINPEEEAERLKQLKQN